MYDRLIPPERIHPWGDEDLLEATEQDRTRIVQAAPVRRLQQKTQVFPLDVKASVRSRLTHSLEVQETGRQISRRILAANGCAVLQHGRLDSQHQRFVAGRDGGLQRLKPIEVGRQTQAHGRRRVTAVQSGQALLQPQARQGRAGGLARVDHLGVRPQIGQRRAAIGLGQGFFDTGRRGGGQRPHLTEVVTQGGIGLPLLLALLF